MGLFTTSSRPSPEKHDSTEDDGIYIRVSKITMGPTFIERAIAAQSMTEQAMNADDYYYSKFGYIAEVNNNQTINPENAFITQTTNIGLTMLEQARNNTALAYDEPVQPAAMLSTKKTVFDDQQSNFDLAA